MITIICRIEEEILRRSFFQKVLVNDTRLNRHNAEHSWISASSTTGGARLRCYGRNEIWTTTASLQKGTEQDTLALASRCVPPSILPRQYPAKRVFNMRFGVISLLAYAAAVSAIGDAVVVNHTNETVYLWSVGDTTGEQATLMPGLFSSFSVHFFLFWRAHADFQAGAVWSEEFRRGKINPGVAVKITKVKGGLSTGAPTQILGYSLDGARVWYSLDAVNGEPFAGHEVAVTSKNGPSIVWPQGKDIGDVTRDSSSEDDVVLTIGGEKGKILRMARNGRELRRPETVV